MVSYCEEGQSATRFLSPQFLDRNPDSSKYRSRANLVGETASILGEFHRHRASIHGSPSIISGGEDFISALNRFPWQE